MAENVQPGIGNPLATGILDAALEIATKRREIIARMRAAFEHSDTDEALRLAQVLCGLKNEEESH
jgi:hypothetical protein